MKNSPDDQEIERLLQGNRIAVVEDPTRRSFVCVYSSGDSRDGFHCYSFLLPINRQQDFLGHVAWDLRPDNFSPRVECEEQAVDGERRRKVYYLPHGNEYGAEALVHTRYYWKNYPPEIEIAEEFRLFWNLFHDRSRGLLLHCDNGGTEHEVVRIKESYVEIQLRFLVDFLRAKQMHLGLQWEGNYWSRRSLEELGMKSGEQENTGALFRRLLILASNQKIENYQSVSRLLGKAIIPCPGDVEYRDPFEGDDVPRPEFIVGQDSLGQPITDVWDETRQTENALTPVFFKRAVLGRYFAEPETYEVGDGRLRCPGFWDLRMDNDHPKHVIVWLKDLWQGLPLAEREHWRRYNIVPDGSCSRTFYTRNLRAWPADPEMPNLRLKQLYPIANKKWRAQYGWSLWREPHSEDRYVFSQLHVCLDENQTEFDQQNALLAKLLVDLLDEENIVARLKDQEIPAGGINRLELLLTSEGVSDARGIVNPLRTVQSLRSAGAAHAKGTRYAEAMERTGLQGRPLIEASMALFHGAVAFVEGLIALVEGKEGPE
jgi:hypothetical protein